MKALPWIIAGVLLIPDALLAVIVWAANRKVRSTRPWNE